MPTLSPHPSRIRFARLSAFCLSILAPGAFVTAAGAAPHWVATTSFTPNAILSLAATPHGPSFLLASAAEDVFRSADGGATWTKTAQGLANQSTTFLGFDPQFPRTVYARRPGQINELWESKLAGRNWFPVVLPYNCGGADSRCSFSLDAFAIDPQAPNDLSAAGTFSRGPSTPVVDFLLRRPNPGAPWNNTPHPAGTLSLAVEPGATGTWYALTCGGLFRSPNGRAGWRKVGLGLATACAGTGVRKVIVDSRTPGTVYVAMGDGLVFSSSDGGGHFAKLEGVPGIGLFEILIDPVTGKLTAGVGGRGVFAWTAHRWQQVGTGLPDTFDGVLTADLHPPGALYAGAADGTVYRLER